MNSTTIMNIVPTSTSKHNHKKTKEKTFAIILFAEKSHNNSDDIYYTQQQSRHQINKKNDVDPIKTETTTAILTTKIVSHQQKSQQRQIRALQPLEAGQATCVLEQCGQKRASGSQLPHLLHLPLHPTPSTHFFYRCCC